MKPIARANFGEDSIIIRFHNGTTIVNGNIVRQIGTKRFIVSDGSVEKTVSLTDDPTIALTLDKQNGGNNSIDLAPWATIVAVIDGERHYVKTIWSQLLVTISGAVAKWSSGDDAGEIPLNRLSNIAPSTNPRIDGDFVVGETVTLSHGVWNIVPESYEYIWLTDGDIIADESAATLELSSDMLGKRISATVVVTYEGGTGTYTTPSQIVSADYVPVALVAPAVSGDPRIGQLLTANVGEWSNSPEEFLIQWTRDGDDIVGETGSTYTVTAGDVGSSISFTVVANKPSRSTTGTADAAAVGPIPEAAPMALTMPVISGDPRVGEIVTTTNGTWSAEPDLYLYSWYVNGVEVAGADEATYLISSDSPIGAALQCRVIAQLGSERSEAAPSQTMTILPALPLRNTTLPSISGTLVKGSTATAVVGVWENDPDGYYFKWYSNGVLVGENSTLVITSAFEGKSLSVTVEANKYGTSSVAASSASVSVPISLPVSLTPPVISGTVTIGSTLTATTGTWDNGPAEYSYQWLADGEDIPHAKNATLLIDNAQLGKKISVTVTASKAGASLVSATSAETIAVPQPAPVNITLPVITGLAQIGETLTVNTGTWTNNPTDYSYQWLADGVAIVGETTNTLVLTSENAGGRQISVRVNAIKAGTTPVAVTTAETALVEQIPPVNTVAPSISVDDFLIGETITSDIGEWENVSTEFTYQWYSDGNAIAGATLSTLVITADMELKSITLRVTALKTGASLTVETNAITVPAIAPLNTALPTISGTFEVGGTVTGTNGTWNVPVELSYQWLADSSPLAGATGPTLVVTSAMVGKRLAFQVTASKVGFGDAVVSSATSVPIPDPAPVNLTPPVITGTPLVDSTLTTSNGTWSGTTETWTYQWFADGLVIEGQFGQTLAVTETLLGRKISVKVTANRSGGIVVDSPFSEETAAVAHPVPVNTTLPIITGTNRVGETLTVSNGAWTNSPTSYTRQWYLDGAAISGATGNTLVILIGHVDRTISARVTAVRGSSTSIAAQTIDRTITVAVPVNSAVPVLSTTTPMVGNTVTATTGSWSNSPTSYTYQWLADGEPISGATSSSHVVGIADYGKRLSVRVNAVLTGTVPTAATSAQSDAVSELLPILVTAPVLSGSHDVGQNLTCTDGVWSMSPSSLTRQWYSDDVAISGATGSSLILTMDHVGKRIHCAVVAVGSASSSPPAMSNKTPPVTNLAPSNTTPPVISGATVGSTATVSNGTWSGGIADSYSYRWTVASTEVSTAQSYDVIAADEGKTISATVTATKTAGSQSTPVTVSTSVPWRVPANITPPTMTGTPAVGETLTLANGTWSPSAISYLYEWHVDGSLLSSSTSDATFVIPETAISKQIVGSVTAIRGDASTKLMAGTTSTIPVPSPKNTTLPVITGTPAVGQTLTVNQGTWQYSPTGFSYQWLANGAEQAGETTNSLSVTDSYAGKSISVRVTAEKAGATSTTVTTLATAVVGIPTPVNTVIPMISGTAAEGQTLTASTGTWSNNPTGYTYQWKADGSDISGATASTLVLLGSHVGKVITVTVNAVREGTTPTAATSAATGAVVGAVPAPANVSPPTITGEPYIGRTLEAQDGAWTNSPTSFTYQWRRGSTNIAGATGKTYTIDPADSTNFLSVVVTAHRGDQQSLPATSEQTLEITYAAPVNVTAPQIIISFGTEFRAGSTITCTAGVWDATPTATRYRWTADGAQFSTSQNISLSNVQDGKDVICYIGTRNGNSPWSADAASQTVTIISEPLTATTAPVITSTTGIWAAGVTISTSNGGWTKGPTSYTYTWFRNGTQITGATGKFYILSDADVGATLTATVTAHKKGTPSVSNDAAATPTIMSRAPVNTAPPVISGTGDLDTQMTVSTGTWNFSPTSFTYQWMRNGSAISGETTNTYTVTPTDQGTSLTVQVTAVKTGAPSTQIVTAGRAIP